MGNSLAWLNYLVNEIRKLAIVDKSMTEDGYAELANLLNVMKCNELQLVACDLNKNKLAELLKKCEKRNVEIKTLGIYDKSMTEDGYGELANLLSVTKGNELHLVYCDLNKNKLAKLSQGNVKIHRLVTVDKSMTEDGYVELGHLLNVTKCNELQLQSCDLNKNKLTELSAECQKGNVKVGNFPPKGDFYTVRVLRPHCVEFVLY